MNKKYKIIIIEPSPVIQQGIKLLLEENNLFEVVYIFSDFLSFQENRKKIDFHALLINPAIINFHKQFSIKALIPNCPDATLIAIHYNYVDSETISGFDGVLDIYDDAQKIVKRLLKVIETSNRSDNHKGVDNIDLSDREKEILISVAQGLTNKQIADKHYISIHTVISHRKNISRKTGIKTVSGLTIYALFNNLISQEDI